MIRPAEDLAASESPFAVPQTLGHVPFRVVGAVEELFEFFALLMCQVQKRGLPANMLRVAGGCQDMSDEVRASVLNYLVQGLSGYRGLISSGGTRETQDGRVKLMITDILQLMAEHARGRVVTLGTVPRTDTLRLVDNSRLVLDAYDTAPQPGVHQLVVLQPYGSERRLGWDGDVVAYLDMMARYLMVGSISRVQARPVLVAIEGGQIVRQEIVLAASRGFPVILCQGYGRQTDAVARSLAAGEDVSCSIDGRTVTVPRQYRHRIKVVSGASTSQLRNTLAMMCLP